MTILHGLNNLGAPEKLDGAVHVATLTIQLLRYAPAFLNEFLGEEQDWETWLATQLNHPDKTHQVVIKKRRKTQHLCATHPLWVLMWQLRFLTLGNAQLNLLAIFLFHIADQQSHFSLEEVEFACRALRRLFDDSAQDIQWGDILADLTGQSPRSRRRLGKNFRRFAEDWPVGHHNRNYLQRLAIFFGDTKGSLGRRSSRGVTKSKKRYFTSLSQATDEAIDDGAVLIKRDIYLIDEMGEVNGEDQADETIAASFTPVLRADLGSPIAVITADEKHVQQVAVGRKIKKSRRRTAQHTGQLTPVELAAVLNTASDWLYSEKKHCLGLAILVSLFLGWRLERLRDLRISDPIGLQEGIVWDTTTGSGYWQIRTVRNCNERDLYHLPLQTCIQRYFQDNPPQFNQRIFKSKKLISKLQKALKKESERSDVNFSLKKISRFLPNFVHTKPDLSINQLNVVLNWQHFDGRVTHFYTSVMGASLHAMWNRLWRYVQEFLPDNADKVGLSISSSMISFDSLPSRFQVDEEALTMLITVIKEQIDTCSNPIEFHNKLTAYTALMFMAATGCRPNRGIVPPRSAFDFENQCVEICDKKVGYEERLRTVPLSPLLQNQLKVYALHTERFTHIYGWIKDELNQLRDADEMWLFFIQSDYSPQRLSAKRIWEELGIKRTEFAYNFLRHQLHGELSQHLPDRTINALMGHWSHGLSPRTAECGVGISEQYQAAVELIERYLQRIGFVVVECS